MNSTNSVSKYVICPTVERRDPVFAPGEKGHAREYKTVSVPVDSHRFWEPEKNPVHLILCQ